MIEASKECDRAYFLWFACQVLVTLPNKELVGISWTLAGVEKKDIAFDALCPSCFRIVAD